MSRTLLVYGSEEEIKLLKLMAFKARMKVSRFIILSASHYGKHHCQEVESIAKRLQNLETIRECKAANVISGSLIYSKERLNKKIAKINEEYSDDIEARDLLIFDAKRLYAKSNKSAMSEIKRRNER